MNTPITTKQVKELPLGFTPTSSFLNRKQRRNNMFGNKVNWSKSKAFKLQRIVYFPRVEPLKTEEKTHVNYTHKEVIDAYKSGKPVASIKLVRKVLHTINPHFLAKQSVKFL